MNMPIKRQTQFAFPWAMATRKDVVRVLAWGLLAILLALSWDGADMRPQELISDGAEIFKNAADIFSPEFNYWHVCAEELLVSFQMAMWGTALSILFAGPIGLLCGSKNTPDWIRRLLTGLMNGIFSVHEMIFAMVFVALVGFGPFAGVLALCIHNTSALSRQIAAGGLTQENLVGPIPRLLPAGIDQVFCRFEASVRSAVAIGLVGAGGIGGVVWDHLRSFQYSQASAAILLIVLALAALSFLMARLRTRLQ